MAFGAVLLVATTVHAQVPSSIVGVVKDSSGGVMPGVTVEASSPALIEKVRSVTTDVQGQYRIVDLRPGIYSVTFTLPGFSVVKREGIELTSGFAAAVGAELKVGGVEESITVSGGTPLVDVQNSRKATVLTAELVQTIPGSKGISTFVQLAPGVSSNPAFQDVGGTQNDNGAAGMSWNARPGEFAVRLDGMHAGSILGTGGGRSRGLMINAAIAQESNIAMGGKNAEDDVAGTRVNLIPKEGGNSFSGMLFVNGTNSDLQSDNLTDEVRGRGLTRVNTISKIWDLNSTLGGRIVQDKLWFFLAARSWGHEKVIGGNYFNATQGTPVYTPDLSRPALKDVKNRDFTGRLTWQPTPKNKINFHYTTELLKFLEQIDFNPVAPEAAPRYTFDPNMLMHLTWTLPVTSKFLIEAGGQFVNYYYPISEQPGVKVTDISILELSTGYTYNALAPATGYGQHRVHHYATRLSASYVTGSHAMKVGLQTISGNQVSDQIVHGDRQYSFLRGVPSAITQWVTPLSYKDNLRMNLGAYAQDQWTANRLTLNLGLRFDYLNAFVGPQSLPAAPFRQALSFGEVLDKPNWKDISPRIGAVYDLFGNSKTAIKGSLGRYIVGESLALVSSNNPVKTIITNTSRTWGDTNGNFEPDCVLTLNAANGECGAVANAAFGTPRVSTRYSDEYTKGYGVRPYNWLLMGEVQHELVTGVSTNVAYIRRWYGNFIETANTAFASTDFSPYSITAPVDPRLPGGGGYVIGGLFDVVPGKFGLTDNLVGPASAFGKESETANFINVTMNARLPRGATLSGGFDTGRTEIDRCDVVASNPQVAFNFYTSIFGGAGAAAPRTRDYCDVVVPWRAQTQFKLLGAYPLPWDTRVSANFQNLSGIPRTASFVATNAMIAPSLGRNLAAGANGTVVVDLIAPYTQFEGRINQLDIRLSKTVRMGKQRLEGQFDMYNATNRSPVLSMNTRYGTSWLTPIQIMDGRILKFGVQYTF